MPADPLPMTAQAASQDQIDSEVPVMFDPVTNITSLLGMVFGILGTTISALFLPFITVVVVPIQSILQWLAGGAV